MVTGQAESLVLFGGCSFLRNEHIAEESEPTNLILMNFSGIK